MEQRIVGYIGGRSEEQENVTKTMTTRDVYTAARFTPRYVTQIIHTGCVTAVTRGLAAALFFSACFLQVVLSSSSQPCAL